MAAIKVFTVLRAWAWAWLGQSHDVNGSYARAVREPALGWAYPGRLSLSWTRSRAAELGLVTCC